jgi:putrescine aminotransferase
MIATDHAYAPFNRDPFLHSSTFAASPIAMAAAAATVRVIREEGLVERAKTLGNAVLPVLSTILTELCPDLVTDVRGVGLLIGIELRDEGIAAELTLELLERHVLVNHSLNAHRVIRLTPPAVLTDADTAWLLDAFTEAATAVAARHATHRTTPARRSA